MPPLPWQLAGAGGCSSRLPASSARGRSPRSLAIAFALFWMPHALPRAGRCRRSRSLLTVLYPFYRRRCSRSRCSGVWPDVATGVYMIVFVMMAVGLNIVVGYAGLLDLGYVAFYATGAYTAAWFASLQFPHRDRGTSARVGIDPQPARASTSRSGSLLLLAGMITALFGIIIGLPTLRLRGDYLAIVTLGFGEIIYHVARNGDNSRHRLQPDERPERDHADRLDRASATTSRSWTGGLLPANYLQCCNAKYLGHQIQSTDLFFWTAIVLLAVHGLLLAAAAVLAPRPRLDRDPRGRDRRRGDGHPADADEDVGVRERRVLRRHRRRVLRRRSRARRSRATSTSTSRSSSSAWSSSAGWGTSAGVIVGGGVPRLPEPGGPREHRRVDQRERPHRQPPPEPRRAAVRLRDLRR